MLGYGKVTGREGGVAWSLELTNRDTRDANERDSASAVFAFEDSRLAGGTLMVMTAKAHGFLTQGVTGFLAQKALKAAQQRLPIAQPTFEVTRYGVPSLYVAAGDSLLAERVLVPVAFPNDPDHAASLYVEQGKVTLSYEDFSPPRFSEHLEELVDRGLAMIRHVNRF